MSYLIEKFRHYHSGPVSCSLTTTTKFKFDCVIEIFPCREIFLRAMLGSKLHFEGRVYPIY